MPAACEGKEGKSRAFTQMMCVISHSRKRHFLWIVNKESK